MRALMAKLQNSGSQMLRDIKFFLIFIFFIPIPIFADCFSITENQMAIDWQAKNSTSTVEIENHWFYDLNGITNSNFAFSSNENFFEIKLLSNRILNPMDENRPGNKIVNGPDFYGLETVRVRIHCPGHSSETVILDPWEGLGPCLESHRAYRVIGSETFLILKKTGNPIKGIKNANRIGKER